MSYLVEDERFPAQAAKVRLAKKRFIENGNTDLVVLASMIGLDPQYLKKRADEENWSEVRFQDLAQRPTERVAAFEERLAAEDDPMQRHAIVADYLVEISFELAKALSSPDINAKDLALLRSKIEAAKSLAEAAVDATDMARKVRGIEEGTPSSGRVAESTKVTYEVAINPRKTA